MYNIHVWVTVHVADHKPAALCRDSGLRREELRTAMDDQRVWRAIRSPHRLNECTAHVHVYTCTVYMLLWIVNYE